MKKLQKSVPFWVFLFLSLPVLEIEIPDSPTLEKCFQDSSASISASPSTSDIGKPVVLNVKFHKPVSCQGMFVLKEPGKSVNLFNTLQNDFSDTITVAHMVTAEYSIELNMISAVRKYGSSVGTVNLPQTINTNCNSSEYTRLFVAALAAGNRIIYLANNLDLDMTGYQDLPVAEGTQLIGFRNFRTPGALIYTRVRPSPLLKIDGNNVELTGFRLHGPDFGLTDGKAVGIKIDSKHSIEFSNMEIAGWSSSGIAYGNTDPANRDEYVINIHDNFIHHNQHAPGGSGYGVLISGAFAKIERNVFDYNRHAIAGGRSLGSGYLARHNLILKGGGMHCADGSFGIDFLCAHTHQFDQHGDKNIGTILRNNQHLYGCWSREELDTSKWNCWTAGDLINVISNASNIPKITPLSYAAFQESVLTFTTMSFPIRI
jgi:hypothetical protein